MTTPAARVAPVQLVTNSLLAALLAEGLRVGDHEIPKDHSYPYSILYQISEAPEPSGPPLTGPEEDMWIGFQVTSVGSGRKQAQWQADRIRRFITGRDDQGRFLYDLPEVAGWGVAGRLGSTPSGVVPEGPAPSTLFNVPDRFALHVTPA